MNKLPPIPTNLIILDTSIGPLSCLLYGNDSPVNVGYFMSICKNKYFTGSIASYVHKQQYIVFSNPMLSSYLSNHDPSVPHKDMDNDIQPYYRLLSHDVPRESYINTFGAKMPNDNVNSTKKQAHTKFKAREFDIDQIGLIFMSIHPCSTPIGVVNSINIYITLGTRRKDYLYSNTTLIGEVFDTDLAKLKRVNSLGLRTMPPAWTFSYGVIGLDSVLTETNTIHDNDIICHTHGCPLRLIRVRHVYIIETGGKCRLNNTLISTAIPDSAIHAFYCYLQYYIPHSKDKWMILNKKTRELHYNPCYTPPDVLSSDDGLNVSTGGSATVDSARKTVQQERINKTRLMMLKLMNEIPDTDMKPPENVIFVCRLNPITTASSLSTCFSKFGDIKAVDLIKDRKTGASLQYAFIEFSTIAEAELAFEKMDNVLIDDCRIHVDFCQSVSKVYFNRNKHPRLNTKH